MVVNPSRAFVEREFGGREPSSESPVACPTPVSGARGASTATSGGRVLRVHPFQPAETRIREVSDSRSSSDRRVLELLLSADVCSEETVGMSAGGGTCPFIAERPCRGLPVLVTSGSSLDSVDWKRTVSGEIRDEIGLSSATTVCMSDPKFADSGDGRINSNDHASWQTEP